MPEGRRRILYCHKDMPQGTKRMTGALEQSDITGRPAFHHRTGAEWCLLGENPSTDQPGLEARCLSALAELRARWDGRITGDTSGPGTIDAPDVAVAGQYRYRRLGMDERVMIFRPEREFTGDSRTRDGVNDPYWTVARSSVHQTPRKSRIQGLTTCTTHLCGWS